jgi:hypothetical protein
MVLRYLFAPLLCFVAAPSPGNADLIQANFAGGAGGIAPYYDSSGNYLLNGFFHDFYRAVLLRYGCKYGSTNISGSLFPHRPRLRLDYIRLDWGQSPLQQPI